MFLTLFQFLSSVMTKLFESSKNPGVHITLFILNINPILLMHAVQTASTVTLKLSLVYDLQNYPIQGIV